MTRHKNDGCWTLIVLCVWNVLALAAATATVAIVWTLVTR